MGAGGTLLLIRVPFSGPLGKNENMCITTKTIYLNRGPTPRLIEVACGRCWQCRKSKVQDWVGRSMCEAAYSSATVAITLTYADSDDLSHKILKPLHFQKFIRSLRRKGHSLRYLAAGEYGSLTGRAHFHCVLFLRSHPKAISLLREQIGQKSISHMPEWPHGHVFADWAADEKAVRYVCKYMLKGEIDGKQFWSTCSKKPAIGSAFFIQKARRDAELGVFTRAFEYVPPNTLGKWRYTFSGAIRRDYLEEFIAQLSIRRKISTRELSEWVRASVEKLYKWQHQRRVDAVSPEEQFIAIQEQLDERRISLRRARYLAAMDAEFDGIEESPFSYEKLLARQESGCYDYGKLQGEVAKWHDEQRAKRRTDAHQRALTICQKAAPLAGNVSLEEREKSLKGS